MWEKERVQIQVFSIVKSILRTFITWETVVGLSTVRWFFFVYLQRTCLRTCPREVSCPVACLSGCLLSLLLPFMQTTTESIQLKLCQWLNYIRSYNASIAILEEEFWWCYGVMLFCCFGVMRIRWHFPSALETTQKYVKSHRFLIS